MSADFNAIYLGDSLSDLNPLFHTTPERPLLGVATGSQSLWVNVGSGWVNVGSTGSSASGAGFSTDPVTINPTGATSYTLPTASVNPGGSFLIFNGVKQTFGVFYTISGDTLNILGTPLPQEGDTLQVYYI
jgi:hypothetical protein